MDSNYSTQNQEIKTFLHELAHAADDKMSERKRILSKAEDYTEKSAKIELKKRGKGHFMAPSPYNPGRFIVFRYAEEE